MSRILPAVWAVLAIATVASCGGDARKESITAAFDRLHQGLKDADGQKLWTVVDDGTRDYFDKYASNIRKTCELVEKHYPADGKAAAGKSVGCDMLAQARDGGTLFSYVLDPRKLVPPKDSASSRISEITFSGNTATVLTAVGDTVVFRQNSDGSFGTPIFLEAFKELPAIVTLDDNMKVVSDNLRLLGVDIP